MTAFEFIFSLISLLLGLSLAEVLGGFARTVQARRRIRLGWLTPLLGALLAVDLITFWAKAWRYREALAVGIDLMVYLTLLAGIYYAAASLVFPHDHDEWPDLDDYFMAHKKMVMGAVLGVNLLVLGGEMAIYGNPFTDLRLIIADSIFFATGLGIVFARTKRLSGVLLVVMLSLYWVLRHVLPLLRG
jgi:hypothetical protein